MKSLFPTILLVFSLSLLTSDAIAQPKHGFAFRTTWYNYVTPLKNEYDWQDILNESAGRGVELAYYNRFDKKTSLVIPVKFGAANLPRSSRNPGRSYLIGNLDLLIQRDLFKHNAVLNPYVHFGAGTLYNFDNDNLDFNIPLGVGLKLKFFDNFYLNAQTQFRPSSRKHPGWHHGVGFIVYFGDVKEEPKDRDKDGVLDLTDRCPDEFGLAELGGCPDRDGDKVADMDDKCPDIPGVASLAGCPDKDADGITDADDECPNDKGVAAFKGCPDTDSDGIADKNDKCPTQAGPASNNGCPVTDKDGDGIEDKDDACPNDKGPAATRGCPDRDSDGIADKDDACPDKKGTPAGRGCPDSDGDGVYDNEDRCIDKPGPASNKGCPELKAEDKAKLADVIKNVQFETGKSNLLQRSYAVLDEVVGLMQKYPEYSLSISGHTDDVGDDKMNKDLSERRAKACFDYLVSKGVAASRMNHAGYGETRPIADNKTKAGRDQNRRVDFELKVK